MERLQQIMDNNPEGAWEDWIKTAYFQRISLSATGFYQIPNIGYSFETNTGNPFSYFTYGVGCTEVEIDCLTGDHKVELFVTHIHKTMTYVLLDSYVEIYMCSKNKAGDEEAMSLVLQLFRLH